MVVSFERDCAFSCFYDNDLPLDEREAETVATRRAYLDTLGRVHKEKLIGSCLNERTNWQKFTTTAVFTFITSRCTWWWAQFPAGFSQLPWNFERSNEVVRYARERYDAWITEYGIVVVKDSLLRMHKQKHYTQSFNFKRLRADLYCKSVEMRYALAIELSFLPCGNVECGRYLEIIIAYFVNGNGPFALYHNS